MTGPEFSAETKRMRGGAAGLLERLRQPRPIEEGRDGAPAGATQHRGLEVCLLPGPATSGVEQDLDSGNPHYRQGNTAWAMVSPGLHSLLT